MSDYYIDDGSASAEEMPLFATTAEITDQGKLSKRESFKDALKDMPKSRSRVYAALVAAGTKGATRFEVAERIGMKYTSVSGRVKELKDKKLVIDTTEKRKSELGEGKVVMCVEFYDSLCASARRDEKSSSRSDAPFEPSHEREESEMRDYMPGQVTCTETPIDDRGEMLQAGRIYLIDNKRHIVFHDCEVDQLFIQRVDDSGHPFANAPKQAVDELDARRIKPIRIDPQIEGLD